MQPEVFGTMGDVTGTESGPLLFRNLSWTPVTEAVAVATPDVLPEVELPRVMEAAREEGRRAAAAELAEAMEQRVIAERQSVASALDAFLSEKKRYFAGLEKEVVRLALAIAEKVLHRETAMDPTLLAGAARVALEQVDQESSAVLLVATSDVAQWQTALPAIGREVELRASGDLERGECVLQTEAGSFELGLRAQLCEIERGFFELIGRTPAIAG